MNFHQLTSRRNSKQIFLISILLILIVLLQACSSTPDELAVGDQAPDFRLPSSVGNSVALSDYTGDKPVLLYFHMAKG